MLFCFFSSVCISSFTVNTVTHELNNIINKKGVSDIVVELKSELQSWMEQQGDFGLESELQVEKKLPKKADY